MSGVPTKPAARRPREHPSNVLDAHRVDINAGSRYAMLEMQRQGYPAVSASEIQNRQVGGVDLFAIYLDHIYKLASHAGALPNPDLPRLFATSQHVP